jgi:hypothetical protein
MKFKFQNLTTLFAKPPEKRLVFYHLPKTAGSSLRSSLESLYFQPKRFYRRPYSMSSARATLQLSQMTGDDLLDIRERALLLSLANTSNRLFVGHLPYSCLAYKYFRDEALFMSLFREPVARFLSLYFYNRYKVSDHFKIDCSLDEFIDSEMGIHSARQYIEWFGRSDTEAITDAGHQYDVALENMQNLDVVGTVENMGALRKRLEDALSRKLNIVTINRNPRKSYMDEVTDEQIKKIEELCEADIRLYHEAVSLSTF